MAGEEQKTKKTEQTAQAIAELLDDANLDGLRIAYTIKRKGYPYREVNLLYRNKYCGKLLEGSITAYDKDDINKKMVHDVRVKTRTPNLGPLANLISLHVLEREVRKSIRKDNKETYSSLAWLLGEAGSFQRDVVNRGYLYRR